MQRFEWDPVKEATNLKKHGIPFEAACAVFDDLNGYDFIDLREEYGEERSVMVGMVRGVILWVVYTAREDRIRLISARLATRKEQNDYFRRLA